MDDSPRFNSPKGLNQFIADIRPDENWVALEDELPFLSWEERAYQEFLAAINRTDDQGVHSVRTRQ